MEEHLLATHFVTADDGSTITLSYYLLAEELTDTDGVPVCELYGARITKQRAGQITSHSIPRITVLGHEILHIVKSLATGTVFPETMADCILELLP